MTWTKLEGSEIWKMAQEAHADARRVRHAFSLPLSTYDFAEKIGVRYSEFLDLFILGKSVFFGQDDSHDKSAQWIIDNASTVGMSDHAETAARCVMMTRDMTPPDAFATPVILELQDLIARPSEFNENSVQERVNFGMSRADAEESVRLMRIGIRDALAPRVPFLKNGDERKMLEMSLSRIGGEAS